MWKIAEDRGVFDTGINIYETFTRAAWRRAKSCNKLEGLESVSLSSIRMGVVECGVREYSAYFRARCEMCVKGRRARVLKWRTD